MIANGPRDPGAVRLVQPQHERVLALGELDRVDDEVCGVVWAPLAAHLMRAVT